MNIIIIMLKDLKHNFRNKRALMMMVLFPIVLMSVLGLCLSGAFEGNKINFNTKIVYSISGNGSLEKPFMDFSNSLKDMGILFIKSNSEKEALDGVKNTEYSAYVKIDETEKKFTLYKNDKFDFSASLIESALKSFVQRYNVLYEISKVNPSSLNAIGNSSTKKTFINTIGLDKKRAPRAKDYYAITMLTLIIMYGSMSSSSAIINERIRKTYSRVIGTPVRRYEYFVGKLFGSVLVTTLQILLVVLFSKYILKAYLGENLVVYGIIIFSEIIMSVSIGQGIAYIIKNDSVVHGLLNAIIPIMVLLGGGYFPLEQFGSNILSAAAKISPIKWVNDSILNVIYDGDYSKVIPAVVINLSIAFVFIILASKKYQGEAA